jgi:predicted negative regulator of RcsB-dependent stress response
MARKITRKELKQDEFVDAAVDLGHWLEKNWQVVARWGAVVVVVVLLTVGWVAWARHTREQAEVRLAAALVTYDRLEADGFSDSGELEKTLGELTSVAEDAGGSAASVARLYRGSALFQLERYDEAEKELKDVVDTSAQSSTLFATAHSVLANVYQATGRTDDAVRVLDELLDAPEARVPADQTLLQIGQIYSAAGQDDAAREHWQRVVDEYPDGIAASEARELLNS